MAHVKIKLLVEQETVLSIPIEDFREIMTEGIRKLFELEQGDIFTLEIERME